VAGLLCLLAAQLNSNRGLGPISAVGILIAVIAMLTLLPAILVIVGRGVFWPFVPRFGSSSHETSGVWARIGQRISHRPRPVWIGTALLLGVAALGLLRLDTNLNPFNGFRSSVDSVAGQKIIAESYPGGATAPTDVIVRPPSRVAAAAAAVRGTPGVAIVSPPQVGDGVAAFQVVLRPDPYSTAAYNAIDAMRQRVKAAAGPGALVGGQTAVQLDSNRTASRDFKVIAPLILVVITLILGLLLRAVVAPLLLVLTVILSFLATLGVSVLVFEFLFNFEGMDPGVPLLSFVFLVALGVDYNIFLMARVREESISLGTHAGTLRGLAVTGGVITSAGIVLAGTFSVLGVLPLVILTEIGFIVAFGVLLDTLLVRSILVPALTLDVDRRMWLPGRLAGDAKPAEKPPPQPELVSDPT
jgi:RND superfamily putative drug exporter